MAHTMPLRCPTDDGEECNRLSLQNCGADTPLVCAQPPLFASNDNLVTGGVATASTVLLRLVVGTTVEPKFKRRQKPSQKVQSSDVSCKSIQAEGERVIRQAARKVLLENEFFKLSESVRSLERYTKHSTTD